mmetsp:Transcript_10548/g.26421  ORF Transcript_10548/g.26421 Transcript_10548/m.26421 type:complete len:267 (+) Transcript_10548:584-1384(+)
MVLGVHKVSAAPFFACLELAWIHVHTDDLGSLGVDKALHTRQAYSAQAEDRRRRTFLHLGRVPHCAEAGTDAASEQRGTFEIGILPDLGTRDLVHDSVLGEGGGAHEVEDFLARSLDGEAGLRVGLHHSLSSPVAHRGTQVGLLGVAHLAVLAVGLVAGDHVIARLHRRHALADALHHARRLMPQNTGEQALRILSGERVGVGVAERGVGDLHSHFALLRWIHDDGFQRERLLRLVGHPGAALDRLGRLPVRIHGGSHGDDTSRSQ